jgi:hypothetical protein
VGIKVEADNKEATMADTKIEDLEINIDMFAIKKTTSV